METKQNKPFKIFEVKSEWHPFHYWFMGPLSLLPEAYFFTFEQINNKMNLALGVSKISPKKYD